MNQQMSGPTNVQQKALVAQYREAFHGDACPLFRLDEVGFRVQSQHEEDGILLYLFALLGTTNKVAVELCCGDGAECNTANLIINHRWTGLLVDGDPAKIEQARSFYQNHPDTKYWPPKILNTWVSREGVNQLIGAEGGIRGEIDLLSLDIDGVDYWVWKEISVINPRVVVLEINHLWGPEVSVTVPYRPDFVAEFTQYGSDYAGASLAAFVKLGASKGYRLVGTNGFATNAFFVREDLVSSEKLNRWLPQADPCSCFSHPRAQFGMNHRLPGVKHKAWEAV